jgi:hypothetical protein
MTTPTYGPPPDAPAYGQPYPVQPGAPESFGPPPSKTLAVWALALGWIPIVFTWVAAVVLAIVVFDRSRSGRDHGKKLAIGGLVGVGFWVAVIVAVFFARPFAADRDGSGAVSKAGTITIDGLRVGDCGLTLPTSPTNVMHVVPCGQSHLVQVLATFELSGDYPGDDVVDRQAQAGCTQRLRAMPVLQGRSDLHLTLMRPVASSWTRERTVLCMARTDQPTTGSLTNR